MRTINPSIKPGFLPVLSLWQPYASLVAFDEKRFETRKWRTDYRGTILIHAAKTHKALSVCPTDPFRIDLRHHLQPEVDIFPDDYNWDAFPSIIRSRMPFGSIVAKVNLTDCYLTNGGGFKPLLDHGAHHESCYGDYRKDRCFMKLEDVQSLKEPIPWKGRQGWFYVPESIVAEAFQ